MNLEEHMKPITDAARIVRSRMPRGCTLELADLVSIGAEHVLRYVRATDGNLTALVFVSARRAMEQEVRRSCGRAHSGRARKTFVDPQFVSFDELDVGAWDQWRRFVLPIEELIDAKRALLGMQLREAVAWYSHHWLCEELDHLEVELGVSEHRIRQYCAAAREKLAAAWQGERMQTDEEWREHRQRQQEEQRAAAHAQMLADRKARYTDLRRLGADAKTARWGCATKPRYLVAVRQLTAEAAE